MTVKLWWTMHRFATNGPCTVHADLHMNSPVHKARQVQLMCLVNQHKGCQATEGVPPMGFIARLPTQTPLVCLFMHAQPLSWDWTDSSHCLLQAENDHDTHANQPQQGRISVSVC